MAERVLADGPELKPAYTVCRGPVPDERPLRTLAGYPGGADKAGNWVNRQFQLDALGGALQLFAAAARMTTWTPGTGVRRRQRCGPSRPAGVTRTPGCGSWTTTAGPSPA